MSLSVWLKKQRQSRGWTLREATKKLGISRSYLSALEHGQKEPSTEILERIARGYGVRSDEVGILAEERANAEKAIADLPEVVEVLEAIRRGEVQPTELRKALRRQRGAGALRGAVEPDQLLGLLCSKTGGQLSSEDRARARASLSAHIFGAATRSPDRRALRVIDRALAQCSGKQDFDRALAAAYFEVNDQADLRTPPTGDDWQSQLHRFLGAPRGEPTWVRLLFGAVAGPGVVASAVFRHGYLKPLAVSGGSSRRRFAAAASTGDVPIDLVRGLLRVPGAIRRIIAWGESSGEELVSRMKSQAPLSVDHAWIDTTLDVVWTSVVARPDCEAVRGAMAPSLDTTGPSSRFSITPYPTIGASIGDRWDAVLQVDDVIWFERLDPANAGWTPFAGIGDKIGWCRIRGLQPVSKTGARQRG